MKLRFNPLVCILWTVTACGNSQNADAAKAASGGVTSGGASNSSVAGTQAGLGGTSPGVGGVSAVGGITAQGGAVPQDAGTTSGTGGGVFITGGVSSMGGTASVSSSPSGGMTSLASSSTQASGGIGATGGKGTSGGTPATGGMASAAGGGTSGGVSGANGGTVSAGGTDKDGGSSSSVPAIIVKMAWTVGATSSDSSQILLTLPANAAGLPLADLTITWCGRLGGGTQLAASDLKFDQLTLMCPISGPSDCTEGRNYPLNSVSGVSVAGTPMHGCYVIDLSDSDKSLYAGGSLKMVYRLEQNPTGAILNRQFDETWTALVNDQSAGSCTVAASPSVTPVCGM
jgi:hypothetical protein